MSKIIRTKSRKEKQQIELKRQRNHLFPILALVFVGIYLLNHFTLYTSDDYTYHFFYQGEYPTTHLRKITSLLDLVGSQISHWYKWNGRFLAHSIIQCFMQFDKVFFNFCNSLAFLGLGWLLSRWVQRINQAPHLTPLTLSFSYLFLWWLLPEFGKTTLWLSGSINYLWTALFYLSWLYLIFFWEAKHSSYVIFLPLAILGFLAGATNENSAPAIILSSGLYLIYLFFTKKENNIGKWISILFSLLGFYLILASPGSHERASHNALSLSTIINSFLEILRYQRSYFLSIYLLVIVLAVYLFKQQRLKQKQLVHLALLLLAHFASTYILIVSPEIPQRVFFGPTVLLIIICLSLLDQVWPDIALRKATKMGMLAVITATSLAYGFVLFDNYKSYREVKYQYQLIQEAKRQGQLTVEVPTLSEPATLYNAYHTTANLGEGDDYWFNQWMAAYFQMEKISGISPKNEKS